MPTSDRPILVRRCEQTGGGKSGSARFGRRSKFEGRGSRRRAYPARGADPKFRRGGLAPRSRLPCGSRAARIASAGASVRPKHANSRDGETTRPFFGRREEDANSGPVRRRTPAARAVDPRRRDVRRDVDACPRNPVRGAVGGPRPFGSVGGRHHAEGPGGGRERAAGRCAGELAGWTCEVIEKQNKKAMVRFMSTVNVPSHGCGCSVACVYLSARAISRSRHQFCGSKVAAVCRCRGFSDNFADRETYVLSPDMSGKCRGNVKHSRCEMFGPG